MILWLARDRDGDSAEQAHDQQQPPDGRPADVADHAHAEQGAGERDQPVPGMRNRAGDRCVHDGEEHTRGHQRADDPGEDDLAPGQSLSQCHRLWKGEPASMVVKLWALTVLTALGHP